MVRFAEALARSGALVIVPESESLQRGEIRPEETATLVESLEVLTAESDADPGRLGLAGFSVGASLVLLAAEDPRGGELASFVNVLGGYFDARSMLVAVASQEIEVDGVLARWEPDHITRYTFAKHLIDSLPEEIDRVRLSAAFLDDQPGPAPTAAELSRDAAVVLELLQGASRPRAQALIKALPPQAQAWLDAVSPSLRIQSLKPALYAMHDRSDIFIPFTESRRLVAEAPREALRHYTEFQLFAHVTPDRSLPPHVLAVELWKLFRHLSMIGIELL
jgi:hypothetical protein